MLNGSSKGDSITNNYSIDSAGLEEVAALGLSSKAGKGVALGLQFAIDLVYIGAEKELTVKLDPKELG